MDSNSKDPHQQSRGHQQDFYASSPYSSRPLSTSQVLSLRTTYGLNIIKHHSQPPWPIFLFRAFVHPFNVLLIFLAATSGGLGDFQTMGIMLMMVIISAGLRFQQEYTSQRAAYNLTTHVSKRVRVLRLRTQKVDEEPSEITIPTEELVPGDWIRLHPGDLIPADIKIIQGKDLYVTQASLTGEAIPVEKYPLSNSQVNLFIKNRNSSSHSLPNHGGLNGRNKNSISLNMTTDSDSILNYKPKNSNRSQQNRVKRFFKNLLGMRVDLKSDFSNDDDEQTDLDTPNLCYMGTCVVTGSATAIVESTGSSTYFGKMAKELEKQRPQNAFQLGVRRISWIFFITMACLVPPVFLLQGFLNGSWQDALLFALSVAVGLTPEMLPMVVNCCLAKGAIMMSRRKCIVKNLDAIVNIGGIDVLCTDKTGTLTKSVVVLTKHMNRYGKTSRVPLNLAHLNSHFQATQGNPLDDAVNTFFLNNNKNSPNNERKLLEAHSRIFEGRDINSMTDLSRRFRLIDELPFDFVRRRISVLLWGKTSPSSMQYLMICKGAVDETLAVCSSIYFGNPSVDEEDEFRVIPEASEVSPMTPEIINELKEMNDNLNNEGLRVIAVAFKAFRWGEMSTTPELSPESEIDLTFVGFLAFLDPPKESTKDAIKKLREYNVEVKVLTGDSPSVCRKICDEICLPVGSIVRSSDLEGASDKEISELARNGTIFAKLTPLQKSQIIRALKRNGNIVGFLGDGINDAPALAEADVGISVDTGTDIAKDSADVILLDKNIGVVVEGVIIGRTTYGNTIKYIVMAISSNFGNVFSLLVASSWLPFLPMLPIHLLIQNLLYDISQIAIPWDHMDPEFLAVPHRWSMKSVLRFMVCMGPWSSVFDITTFIYMYYYFDIKTEYDDVALFQTTWFTVGLLTQTFIVHMIRTAKVPFIQSWASFPLVVTTIFIVSTGLALPYIPVVGEWLKLVHLEPMVYPYVFGAILSYCIVAQLAKMIYLKLFKEWY